jgi:hypothetical protein
VLPPAKLAWPSALALLALLGAGCGADTMPMTRGARARLLVDPAPRLRRPAPVTSPAGGAPEEALPDRPFAPTPLSSFAEALTDMALGAVRGQPVPASPVPTRAPLGAEPAEVEWWPPGEARPSRLEVLGVGVEADLVLKRGEAPDGGTLAERFGVLRVTFVVNRNGLRVVSLRPGAMSPRPGGGAPPPGLEGLATVARELIAALREGDVSAYQLTEADRRFLANDSVWAQVHEDGPPLGRAREITPLLVGLPDAPLSYRLDDLGLLVRDEQGRLFGLSLELDRRGDSYVLSTTPLVRVRRLWPY